MKLSFIVQKAIDKAFKHAIEKSHEFITAEHLALAVFKTHVGSLIFTACDIDIDKVNADIENYLTEKVPSIKNAQNNASALQTNDDANDSTPSTEKEESYFIADTDEIAKKYPIAQSAGFRTTISNAISNCISSDREVIQISDIIVGIYDA